MDEQERSKVLSGRLAVDAYRLAHSQLHSKPWHKGIPEEHTPILFILLDALKVKGFNNLDQFFAVSEELNTKELGFTSLVDFEAKATDVDKTALDRMWH